MITQPTGIPLPEDVEKAIEAARNNVTLLNAEITRLTKLKSTLDKEVVISATNKSNLEEIINSSKKELETLQKSINDNSYQLEQSKKESEVIQSERVKSLFELTEKRVALGLEEEKLDNSKLEHQSNLAAFSIERQTFLKDKEEFEKKKSLLANTISKL